MIQQGAKMIGPLLNPSSPKTGKTPQEKAAAKKTYTRNALRPG
jgi:hypothetical protein